jgi:hypothetical protein
VVVYANDAYVPAVLSPGTWTAQMIPTMRTWGDAEHRYDGLDCDGDRMLTDRPG